MLPAYCAYRDIKQPFVSRPLKGRFLQGLRLQPVGFLAHPPDLRLRAKLTGGGIQWMKIKAEAKV